jgi:hypothetical protein
VEQLTAIKEKIRADVVDKDRALLECDVVAGALEAAYSG